MYHVIYLGVQVHASMVDEDTLVAFVSKGNSSVSEMLRRVSRREGIVSSKL